MKRLAKLFTIKFIMNILYYKISEFHRMKQKHIIDCDLCKDYYSLCESIDRFKML